MENSKKKKIIILGVGILLIVAAVVILLVGGINNNSGLEHGITVNGEELTKINRTQKVGDLEFSNIEIIKQEEEKSEVIAEVLNTGKEVVETKTIKITVTNKDGLKEIFGGQLSSIPAGEKRTLNATIRKDITSATSIEFEIK